MPTFRMLNITIHIPALDRLMNYLEAAQQAEVNSLRDTVVVLNARLKQSNDRLGQTLAQVQ